MAPTGGQRLSRPSSANANTNTNTVDAEHHQVAASNSTVNAWFGRRQPSWLTNATPVDPTPRSARYQQQRQAPPPTPRPSTGKQPTGAITIVRPLPSSTPESSATTFAVTSSDSDRTAPQQSHPPQQSSRPPPQSHLNSTTSDAVLPSPAPSDEPSPRAHDFQAGRKSPSNATNPPPATETPDHHCPVTEARFVLDTRLNVSNRTSTTGTSTNSSAGRLATSRQSSITSAAPSPSAPASMVLNTPPTPNVPAFGQRIPIQQVPLSPLPPEHPAKRRRLRNPQLEFLESLRAAENLERHIGQSGGERSLESNVERPRFQLLKEACADGDLFFVTFHQLFCLWTTDQSAVHQMCRLEGVDYSTFVDSALGIMGSILRNNSGLSPQRLAWLKEFPSSLPALCHAEIYANMLRQVLNFLVRVSQHWSAVHYSHQSAGYPILMNEFLGVFKLYSASLQTIIFRASRRTLGIGDDNFGTDMENLFKADQQEHRGIDGSFSAKPQSSEYTHYNNCMIQGYRIIMNKAQQARARRQMSEAHHGPNQASSGVASKIVTSVPLVPSHVQTQAYFPQQPSISPATGVQGSTTLPPTANAVPSQARFSPVPQPYVLQGSSPAAHNVRLNSAHQPINRDAQSPSVPQIFYSPPIHHPSPQQFQQQISGQSQVSQPNTTQTSGGPTTVPPSHFQQQYQNTMQFTERMSPSVPNFTLQPVLLPPRSSSMTYTTPPAAHVNANHGHPSTSTVVPHHAPVQASTNIHYVQPSNVRPQHHRDGQQKSAPPASQRLIPPPNTRIDLRDYPHSPYERRSVEMSLHQAHMRSPKRLPQDLDEPSAPRERYYQAIKCFALDPVPIPPSPCLYKFTFTVLDEDLGEVTLDKSMRGEPLPVNRYFCGSLRFRLRCCYVNSTFDKEDGTWYTADASWPEHIFIELNEKALGIKRRAHHSKDFPTEVSRLIHPGENVLHISVPEGQKVAPHGKQPFLAVEIIEVLSHSTILDMVKTQALKPPEVTRQIIKKRLTHDDDDDLAASIDGISIDLADPFTATMFQIPTRGARCTHLECFDLEMWLKSRLGKKSCTCRNSSGECKTCPAEPSFVDTWKCPICFADARPYNLYIDGFLVEVRSQLERDSQLRTKSIIVSADGTWQPKERLTADDSDVDSDEDENGRNGSKPANSSISNMLSASLSRPSSATRSSSTPMRQQQQYREVIELD